MKEYLRKNENGTVSIGCLEDIKDKKKAPKDETKEKNKRKATEEVIVEEGSVIIE